MRLYRRLRRRFWRASMAGLPRGPHITRYYMYDRLRSVGPLLPQRRGRVLDISHSTRLGDVLGLQPTELVEASYPDHDMLSLHFADESFDFVVSDQVLEHVEGDPQQAIDECHRILRPGGIAVHTTCFMNPYHEDPKDFWRFTPGALRLLHKDWSQIIECDGWGNFDVWLIIRDGIRFDGVPHAKWHPLHRVATKNDPEWLIVTWIVVRK